MTAAEALDLLARIRAWLHKAPTFTDAAVLERNQLLSDLVALQCSLAVPATLCTRDELFDAIVCADCDDEHEGPSLLDELLEQIEETAIEAHLSARRARRIEALLRRSAVSAPIPDPSEAP